MNSILKICLRLGYAALKLLWFFTRPVTLGVRAIVLDDAEQVLLVRHSYVSGWMLPGGGVNRGESVYDAARRELREEVRIEARVTTADLRAVFFSRVDFKNDHIALFLVRSFERLAAWDSAPNSPEIEEYAFFPLTALPPETTPATRARIEELAMTETGAKW